MSVTSEGRRADPDDIAQRFSINPTFATKLYDVIAPGTTVVVTDQPIVRSRRAPAILES
jgi:hypothetical protein